MCFLALPLTFKEKKINAQASFLTAPVSPLPPLHFLVVVIFVQPALNCSCSEKLKAANVWRFPLRSLASHTVPFLLLFFTEKLLELCDNNVLIFFSIKIKKKICVCVCYVLNMVWHSWYSPVACLEKECELARVNFSKGKDNNLSSRLEVKQSSQVWNAGI